MGNKVTDSKVAKKLTKSNAKSITGNKVATAAKAWLKNNSNNPNLVSIKDVNENVDKSKLTSIKNANDKTGLVSIKTVNDNADKSKLKDIKGVDEPSIKSVTNGNVLMTDNHGRDYVIDLKDLSFVKDKSKAPKVTQLVDGYARVVDSNGNEHRVKATPHRTTKRER